MNRFSTKAFFNSKWFFRITSLFFAVILFLYVNGSKLQNVRQSNGDTSTVLTSTKSKKITVPLDVTVDSDKYVVSGYPSTVQITVTGPAALVTTTANTQNFKVAADLSKYGTGTHRVKLKVTGLNQDLSYKINPSSVDVTIETRKTISMKVTPKLNDSQIGSNYTVGKATVSTNNVKVTGAVDEVAKVNQVVAALTLTKDAKADVSRKVTLEAVDANGNVLNVVISPSSTTVTVPISPRSSDSGSNSKSDSSSASSDSTQSSNSSSASSVTNTTSTTSN